MFRHPQVFRLPLVLLIACATQAAPAQSIYSWKDASGQVHYSDTPPADGKARTLRQPPLAPAGATRTAAGGQAPQTYAEKELAFRKRRAEAAEAENKADQDKAAAAIRERYCTDARRQLAALESGQYMTRYDASGERVFLDDAERASAIERTRADVERNCK